MPSLVDTALDQKGAGTGIAAKNDPPLSPTGPYSYGPSGLFTRHDWDNPVISTVVGPLMGVADSLPIINDMADIGDKFGGADAVFESFITGVSAGSLDDFANQPTQPCQSGPKGGLLEFGTIVNTSGNYKASTLEVEIHRAGRVATKQTARTVQLLNAFPMGIFATSSGTPSLGNAINNELAKRIWEMFLSFQRMIGERVFIGSPANNNGEARDIVGLDMHINSGNKRDATNGNLITAANSVVFNFGNALVSTTNLMRYIEAADAQVIHRARQQKLGIPSYEIAMHPVLWQELSEYVPVEKYEKVLAYLNNMTNGRGIVDARDVYNERDAIRSSLMLPVNGRFIKVVLDDTIAESSSKPGGKPTYASTVYGIPLTILNGYPVTFWEFFNFANAQAVAIQQIANGFAWSTDGGMFAWAADFARGCLELGITFSPRLRMRTPQLAWRIDSVACQPLTHFDSWDPTSDYFTGSGMTTGENPKYYSEWSSTPLPIW